MTIRCPIRTLSQISKTAAELKHLNLLILSMGVGALSIILPLPSSYKVVSVILLGKFRGDSNIASTCNNGLDK